MDKKIYAIAGNWSFEAKPSRGKGISVFSYGPEDGSLSLLETVRPDVAGGQLCLDQERNIVYVCNECGERRGEIGGGGYIMAWQFHPETGELTLINEKETLCPEPSYVYLDPSKRYLVVCHCSDPWHVTKIIRHEDGSFGNEVVFDDTGLVLFRVNEDGSIGEICDIAVTQGSGGKGANSQVNVDPVSGHIQLVEVISRLHSVVASPSGRLLAVCDKGMDKIYSFRIDTENGKLVRLNEWYAGDTACFPRYGAFHPAIPVFYANNENRSAVNCFHYEEESGELDCFCTVELLEEDYGMVDGKPVGAQDILVHPDGQWMYVTLCGLNLIAVMRLDEKGIPAVVQRIPSGGILPRGLALSPDRRFLLAGNMVSGDITTFRVKEDGFLASTGRRFAAVSPSAIRFVS